jgi:hypothetical protein
MRAKYDTIGKDYNSACRTDGFIAQNLYSFATANARILRTLYFLKSLTDSTAQMPSLQKVKGAMVQPRFSQLLKILYYV